MTAEKRVNPVHRFPVYLMGMKHSGKTTIGKRLAEIWGCRFQDLDEYVISDYLRGPKGSTASGSVGIRDVYRILGSDGFREAEFRASEAMIGAAKEAGYRSVAALGGGTIENDSAMKALARRGTLVYLEEDADLLFSRIIKGGTPAFLDPADPEASFKNLYQKRTALYRQRATISVRLAGLSVEPALELVQQKIEEYMNGGQ